MGKRTRPERLSVTERHGNCGDALIEIEFIRREPHEVVFPIINIGRLVRHKVAILRLAGLIGVDRLTRLEDTVDDLDAACTVESCFLAERRFHDGDLECAAFVQRDRYRHDNAWREVSDELAAPFFGRRPCPFAEFLQHGRRRQVIQPPEPALVDTTVVGRRAPSLLVRHMMAMHGTDNDAVSGRQPHLR